MGAKVGYNILTAFFSLAVCLTGLCALLLQVIPIQALNPILIFVGLVVCADTLQVSPRRHYTVFIFGLAPALCNWCCTQAETLARLVTCKVLDDLHDSHSSGDTCESTNVHFPDFTDYKIWSQDDSMYGLYLLGSNYLLSSIILASMLYYSIDRKLLKAAAWSMVGAVCSIFGGIHAVKLGFLIGEDDMGWRFALGYSLCAALFLGVHQMQTHFPHLVGPVVTPKDIWNDPLVEQGGSEGYRFIMEAMMRYARKESSNQHLQIRVEPVTTEEDGTQSPSESSAVIIQRRTSIDPETREVVWKWSMEEGDDFSSLPTRFTSSRLAQSAPNLSNA